MRIYKAYHSANGSDFCPIVSFACAYEVVVCGHHAEGADL
jgi:hypothetical protein